MYCGSSNSALVSICQNCGSLLETSQSTSKRQGLQITDTRAALPAGTKLDRAMFEIQSVLGRGGFGIAYKALNLTTGETVGIKELFPSFSSRDAVLNVVTDAANQTELEGLIQHMQTEASISGQITDVSALKIQKVFLEHGTAYMVMEYVDGISLEVYLSQRGRLSQTEALEILIPILNVLEELHQHQYLHRDIKPANIMLRKDTQPGQSRVELVDFGSAMHYEANTRTEVTSRILTPAYAPLEQYGEKVMLEPATDLYALAATVYEAVTGHLPPNALDRANGMPLEPIQKFSPMIDVQLASALEKALEMNLKNRFSSAKEMLLALPVGAVLSSAQASIGSVSQVSTPTIIGNAQATNTSMLPVGQNPLPSVSSYPVSTSNDFGSFFEIFRIIVLVVGVFIGVLKSCSSQDTAVKTVRTINSPYHGDIWLAPIRKKPKIDQVRVGMIGFLKLSNHKTIEENNQDNIYLFISNKKPGFYFAFSSYYNEKTELTQGFHKTRLNPVTHLNTP